MMGIPLLRHYILIRTISISLLLMIKNCWKFLQIEQEILTTIMSITFFKDTVKLHLAFGNRNEKRMFERLSKVVNDYNSLGNSKAVLQEFDAHTKKAFILCVVTGLISQVHKKVPQACEIC